jgi:hypothetical protein
MDLQEVGLGGCGLILLRMCTVQVVESGAYSNRLPGSTKCRKILH